MVKTEGLMDLLMFLDGEVEGMAHAMRMAAERNREAVAEMKGTVLEGSNMEALMGESAAKWERKAERLEELAECLPDEIGY